jgi:uncharacterized protein (TIGR02145 family)
MKKILLPLLTILLFTACQKQSSTDKRSEEIAGAAANKQTKFTVCHYDVVTGISKTIEVTQNALAGHLAHGDLQGNCSSVLTTICDQDWMVKNLDVTTYRNGDPIPQVADPTTWASLTTGAWCYYNNDPANGPIYGKLYNGYAVNDPRGLAPTGWHVPSDAEWTTLSTCLGGNAVAGGKMKETGNSHWIDPNIGATNNSGFTALPSGYRDFVGPSYFIGLSGIWWSTSEYFSTGDLWMRYIWNNDGGLYAANFNKLIGISIRCLRD